MKIYFDCETTGISVYNSEIITAYFLREDGEFYNFKSQVNNWSHDAEEIHKIPEYEMHTYPCKQYAYENLAKWLCANIEFVVYANPNTKDGFMYFDTALLKMELMNVFNIDHEASLPIKFSTFSVHTLAKECAKLGLFSPIKKENNRDSFRQTDVYFALFGEKYNAHDAEADVIAMKRIYDTLLELKLENKSIANRKQMSMF